jgi:hypothetical protein
VRQAARSHAHFVAGTHPVTAHNATESPPSPACRGNNSAEIDALGECVALSSSNSTSQPATHRPVTYVIDPTLSYSSTCIRGYAPAMK